MMKNGLKHKFLFFTLAALLAAGNFGAGTLAAFAQGEGTGDTEGSATASHRVVGGRIDASDEHPDTRIPSNIHFRDIEKNLISTGEAERPLLRRGGSISSAPSAFPEGGYLDQDAVLDYLTTNYPATRNQDPYGSCWAMAATTLAEFYNIRHGLVESGKETETDYSEAHLQYWTYSNGTGKTLHTGGATDILHVVPEMDSFVSKLFIGGDESKIAPQTLFRERGFVPESVLPLPVIPDELMGENATEDEWNEWKASVTVAPETERGYNVSLLKDAIALPWEPENNFMLVKEAIMENGAVGVGMAFPLNAEGGAELTNYCAENNAYYLPEDTTPGAQPVSPNHSVVLVGWDDDFPKEYFSTDSAIQPTTGGAWLVRNSWSTTPSLSIDSYFWISYYDAGLNSNPAEVYVMMDPDKKYDNNYYYDAQAHTSLGIRYEEGELTMPETRTANVFTACGEKGAELISAVRFVVDPHQPEGTHDGTDYEVNIYRGTTTEGGLNLGTLCSEARGKIYTYGFYTIPLENPVLVTKGENFAVEVKLEGDVSVMFERAGGFFGEEDIVYEVAIAEGESWVYYRDSGDEEESWNDLFYEGLPYGYGNALISALTMDQEPVKKHRRRSSGGSESSGTTVPEPETQTEQPTNPDAETPVPQEGNQQPVQAGSADSNVFTDVPADSWAANSIKKIVSMGIMKGTGNGKFSPYALMSRGMLSEVFKNLAGGDSAEEGGFGDTAGKWYAKSAAWVKAHNIMGGIGGGLFAGDDPVEREQMMTGYYRLALLQGKVTEEAKAQAKEALSAYPDAGSVSEYAREAMGWGLTSGMLKGMNGKLNPHGKADRAQFCALTERYCGL